MCLVADELMARRWGIFKIWICWIDAGYTTSDVYRLCGHYPNIFDIRRGVSGGMVPTKGTAAPSVKKIQHTTFNYKSETTGRRQKTNTFMIGVNIAKAELYRTLNLDYNDDRVGLVYAPNDYPNAYYTELVAEIPKFKQTSYGKIQTFEHRTGVANEALDLHVLNRMACELTGMPYWTDRKIHEEKAKNAELWKTQAVKEGYDDMEVDKERSEKAKLYEERRKRRIEENIRRKQLKANQNRTLYNR